MVLKSKIFWKKILGDSGPPLYSFFTFNGVLVAFTDSVMKLFRLFLKCFFMEIWTKISLLEVVLFSLVLKNYFIVIWKWFLSFLSKFGDFREIKPLCSSPTFLWLIITSLIFCCDNLGRCIFPRTLKIILYFYGLNGPWCSAQVFVVITNY